MCTSIKPIRFILGFPAGGGSDILVQVIGRKLSDICCHN